MSILLTLYYLFKLQIVNNPGSDRLSLYLNSDTDQRFSPCIGNRPSQRHVLSKQTDGNCTQQCEQESS